MSNETPPPGLQELINAARRGRNADWDLIDERLSSVRNTTSVAWALDVGLHDANAGIRVLAASLIEDWHGPIDNGHVQFIEGRMANDPTEAVCFHLAAGRWKRGDHSDTVDQVIQHALGSTDGFIRTAAKALVKPKASE